MGKLLQAKLDVEVVDERVPSLAVIFVRLLHFYYDGQQLIEERDDSGDLQRQYVWGGLYIHELILFRDVAGEGGTANADYLPLRHHNFNIVALVARATGNVVERYDYTPYVCLCHAMLKGVARVSLLRRR